MEGELMKSIGAYIYIARMKFMASMVYRFEFFASVFASGIMLFATVFLWKAIFHAFTKVDGLTESQMVTYAIFSSLLTTVFNVNVEKAMFDRILQGEIAIDFIRPTHVILSYLAEDIGIAASFFVSKFVPMLIMISIFYYKPMPESILALILSIISAMLSFGILWIIGAMMGLVYMKLYDLANIGFVKDAVIALLSGSIIPIWFFPERIRVVMSFLPFQYTYQTPLGIYIGKYSHYESLISMIIQAIWLCLLIIALNLMWRKYSKNILIQGG